MDGWIDKYYDEYFSKFADYRSLDLGETVDFATMCNDEKYKKCEEIEKIF